MTSCAAVAWLPVLACCSPVWLWIFLHTACDKASLPGGISPPCFCTRQGSTGYLHHGVVHRPVCSGFEHFVQSWALNPCTDSHRDASALCITIFSSICTMHSSSVQCIMTSCIALFVLQKPRLHWFTLLFILPCIALHCFELPCTVLHCLALPCIAQPVVCDPGSSPKRLLQVVAAPVHLSVASRSASPGSLSSLLRWSG